MQKADKHEVNAELINQLDRDYNMLKCYPQTEDPTLLEFWSNNDPRRKAGFVVLMHACRKTCKVTLHGKDDYFIEVDDIDED